MNLARIIDWCFTHRKNGFTIYAKDRITEDRKGAVGCVGRYVRYPAISGRR